MASASSQMKNALKTGVKNTLSFLVGTYGYAPPFKVLLDGGFVTELFRCGLTVLDVHEVFEGYDVVLYVTRCMLEQLKNFVGHFQGTTSSIALYHEAISSFSVENCGHKKFISGFSCYDQILGKDNNQQFFLASVDTMVLSKYHNVPAVPLITLTDGCVSLKEPSKATKKKGMLSKKKNKFQTLTGKPGRHCGGAFEKNFRISGVKGVTSSGTKKQESILADANTQNKRSISADVKVDTNFKAVTSSGTKKRESILADVNVQVKKNITTDVKVDTSFDAVTSSGTKKQESILADVNTQNKRSIAADVKVDTSFKREKRSVKEPDST